MFYLSSGSTPSRKNNSNFQGDINWISSGELKKKYIYYTDEKISDTSLRIYDIDTLIIAIYGLEADGIRGTASLLKIPSTISQACMAIEPISNEVLIEFLYYWYKKHGEKIGLKYAQGTKQQNLCTEIVENFDLSFPIREEQKKIVDFFDVLDNRIETQSKIIKDLISQMNWFIDNIIDISSPQFKFKDLYTVAGEGGTPSTSNNLFYENGNIPFIKIEDLSNKYLISNKDFITELGLKKSSAWMIPANSIIFSNGATIGRISINVYPVSTKQGILGIIPSKVVLTEYLYYFMRSKYFRKQVHRITVKGTMDCAYLKDLNSINCYIPCLDKQKSIVKMFNLLDKKITIEQTILNKLKEQKKFLLTNMFI